MNSVSAPPATKQQLRWVLNCFAGFYVLSGLQAYAVGPVPVDWLASLGFIALALFLALACPVKMPTELSGFAFFAGWVLVNTLVASSLRDYSNMMPQGATNSYGAYLGLRGLAFVGYFSAAYVIWWLCRQDLEERILRTIKLVGAVLAAAALYMFVAHLAGLPEPPRSRMGTSGSEQATYFGVSAFQRALGTFREPSHMAAWMMLPLLLCIRKPAFLFGIPLATICIALLLSGSITGFISVGAALAFALIAFGWRSPRLIWNFAVVVGLFVASVGIYDLAASAVGSEEASFTKMVGRRVEPLLEEMSLKGSNRQFVYHYLDTRNPGIVGVGWGNSNLEFTQYSGSLLVGTFQSLYVNTLLSTGYLGLVILLLAAGWPLARALASAGSRGVPELTAAAAAYVAWLVSYIGLNEELTLSFALSVGLLAWRNRCGLLEKADAAKRTNGATPEAAGP